MSTTRPERSREGCSGSSCVVTVATSPTALRMLASSVLSSLRSEASRSRRFAAGLAEAFMVSPRARACFGQKPKPDQVLRPLRGVLNGTLRNLGQFYGIRVPGGSNHKPRKQPPCTVEMCLQTQGFFNDESAGGCPPADQVR